MKNLVLSLLILFSGAASVHAQFYVTFPLDRSVFQRDASGNAVIVIAGQVMQHPNPLVFSAPFTVAYRLVPLTKLGAYPGTLPSWTTIGSGTPYGGMFRTTVTKSTGWYELQLGAFASGQSTPTLVAYTKVGVGEVIFMSGQSNSQGIEGMTNDAVSTTYLDCVNSINDDQFCKATYKLPVISAIANGRLVSPNSNRSSWGTHYLGKRIAEELNSGTVVPVLFFNSAQVGSNITNWSATANDATANTILSGTGGYCCSTSTWPNSDGTQGQPYKMLRTSLNYFGGMFGARTVIWHQGEADNTDGTLGATYSSALSNVIAKTRSHFNTSLGWAISRVSYANNTTSTTITTAQSGVQTATGTSSHGAWDSDLITSRSDGTHFNAAGLVSLHDQYFTSYSSGSPTIGGLTPISAISSPAVAAVKSGANVTITAPTSTSYCWVQNDGNINSCYSTSQSITVANATTSSYRCYTKNSLGSVSLSQAIRTPIWTVGGAARMAAEIEPSLIVDEEKTDYINIYPNPARGKTSATFNLVEAANIKLQLIDTDGRVISTVAEGPHTAGKHTYPLNVENLKSGLILSVLKVNELFLTKKVMIAN